MHRSPVLASAASGAVTGGRAAVLLLIALVLTMATILLLAAGGGDDALTPSTERSRPGPAIEEASTAASGRVSPRPSG